MDYKAFLESVPPGRDCAVEDLLLRDHRVSFSVVINPVRPSLHCQTCNGPRAHDRESENSLGNYYVDKSFVLTLSYRCSDCHQQLKIFPILASRESGPDGEVRLRKIGEFPPFGEPTPSRVLTLLRPFHDLFTKGRRAENQGLGIGAFAYYRQVVERNKDRLIDEIAKVAKKLGADEPNLRMFEDAKMERQFIKSVEVIKDAIPPSLYLEGQNPLLLLHDALSEDIHSGTDDSAIEVATAIRTVIVGLSARMAAVLDDENEMKSAVHKLLKRRSEAK